MHTNFLFSCRDGSPSQCTSFYKQTVPACRARREKVGFAGPRARRDQNPVRPSTSQWTYCAKMTSYRRRCDVIFKLLWYFQNQITLLCLICPCRSEDATFSPILFRITPDTPRQLTQLTKTNAVENNRRE